MADKIVTITMTGKVDHMFLSYGDEPQAEIDGAVNLTIRYEKRARQESPEVSRKKQCVDQGTDKNVFAAPAPIRPIGRGPTFGFGSAPSDTAASFTPSVVSNPKQ